MSQSTPAGRKGVASEGSGAAAKTSGEPTVKLLLKGRRGGPGRNSGRDPSPQSLPRRRGRGGSSFPLMFQDIRRSAPILGGHPPIPGGRDGSRRDPWPVAEVDPAPEGSYRRGMSYEVEVKFR